MSEIPRRCRLDMMTRPELEITQAIRTIEETMGADTRLTEAQTLLAKARDLVADYIDGVRRG